VNAGARRTLRVAIAVAWLAAPARAEAPRATPEAPPPNPLTLELLMQRFATTRGVRAEFVERKELALLDVPLESRGVIYFVPPRRFARFVREPAPSSFVIDGDRLRFRDAAGGEDVDLSGNSAARAIVDNMIGLWSGDLPALRASYHVVFSADVARWSLALVPRRAPLDRVIERIELAGDGPRLLSMELVEKGGDRTHTHFERSEVDRAFSEEDLARIFAGDGAEARP
jgi:hypothetical protein